MSLGGRDEPSLGVIVYGPDGKAYGSPAQARAAGVENATMSPPPGAPASAPGAYSAPTLDFSTPNIVYAPPMAGPAPAPYNPMGQASLGVVVYGPDGRAYGSPLDARNAGVSNPTMSPPAGIPISYPGRQPYTPAPLPGIPTQSSGGRNRYAEIMSQFGQSQPFSFTGMPSTYTGGFNANPSTYTGGFTPYQRLITPQPALPVEGTNSATTGGGGRGGADREGPSAFSQLTPAERAAYYKDRPFEGSLALGAQDYFGSTLLGMIPKYARPNEWYDYRLEKQGLDPESFASGPPDPNFSSQAAAAARLEAQIAAVNAANAEGAGLVANPMGTDPAYATKVIRDAQVAPPVPAPSTDAGGLLGNAPPTEAQYGAYLAQQQADAAGRPYGTGAVPPTMTQNQFAAQYAAYGAGQQPAIAQAQAQAVAEANARIAQQEAQSQARAVAESNAAAAAASAAAAAAQAAAQNYSNEGRNYGGGGGGGGGAATGGRDTGGGARDASGGGDRGTRGGFAQGGYVSRQHLGGPDPEGPDDGYAALKDGEFVINDKAVKKYGIELMNAINSGKISKGKLRGLLEM